MEKEELLKLTADIYKKTIGYELEKVRINDDGSLTHLHSDRFLDENPERIDLPEFTDEEEVEQIKSIAELAKRY